MEEASAKAIQLGELALNNFQGTQQPTAEKPSTLSASERAVAGAIHAIAAAGTPAASITKQAAPERQAAEGILEADSAGLFERVHRVLRRDRS